MPTPQKIFIAALLPFSFLWVLMACVSICERETLAIHRVTDLSGASETIAIASISPSLPQVLRSNFFPCSAFNSLQLLNRTQNRARAG